MRMRRIKAVAVAATGVGLMSLTALTALPQTTSAAPAPGQSGPAAYGHRVADAPSSSPVDFSLVLNLRDPAGAAALVKSVSDPTSSSYRHYVTAKQWEDQFSPTAAAVNQAETWLKSEGFSVGAIPADRITVPASGTVAQVEKAFGTNLGEYTVNGQTLREADGPVAIPTAIAGSVGAVMGINEIAAQPGALGASPSCLRHRPALLELLRRVDQDHDLRQPESRLSEHHAGHGVWLRGHAAAVGLRHPDVQYRLGLHDRHRGRL